MIQSLPTLPLDSQPPFVYNEAKAKHLVIQVCLNVLDSSIYRA